MPPIRIAQRVVSLLSKPYNVSFASFPICRQCQLRDRIIKDRWNLVACFASETGQLHHETVRKVTSSVETYKSSEDTIAAIATGVQRSAVAIIRVSGFTALPIAKQVFRPRTNPDQWTPISHRIYVGNAISSKQEILDEVLCLVFLSPKSYTGEDVIEIHCHGGSACAQRIMTSCIQAGARPAHPGEFTLRAFLNGKIDLSQAESVLQLIDAKTFGAADLAVAGLKGGIGKTIKTLRVACLDILVELEARLDFDEDMPELDVSKLNDQINSVMESLESCLKTASQGRLLRNGIQIAIIGRPNVGKSSLMNAWCGIDKAIVTDIPGTTRDVIEAGIIHCCIPQQLGSDLSVKGVPVKLLDTAGIRKGSDIVEQMGIDRASATAKGADVVLMVMDYSEGWTESDSLVFTSLWGEGSSAETKKPRMSGILVANKIDKSKDTNLPSLPLRVSETFESVVLTSAKLNKGIEDLDQAVLDCVGAGSQVGGGVAWAINERQSEALFRAHESLSRMTESIKEELPMDLWTIDLREAILCLGEVSGEDLKEELLDNIFNRFCIGK